MHDVAVAGPGTAQRTVHAELVEPLACDVHGVGVGQVVQVDGPERLATLDHEAAVVAAADRDALEHRSERDEALGRGLFGPGLLHQLAQRSDDRRHALAGDRGHGRTVEVGQHLGFGQIRPGSDAQSGPVEQIGSVVAELLQQDRLLFGPGGTGERRQIEQQNQDRRPLDVAKEPVAQAPALGGALDQAGDVGDDHLEAVVGAHHAQVGLQRGEGVIRDLGSRRGDAADQS